MIEESLVGAELKADLEIEMGLLSGKEVVIIVERQDISCGGVKRRKKDQVK